MYQVIEGQFEIEGMAYTAYGIRGENTQIEDVCCNRSAVESLVELCNREVLEDVHLQEVVEDFLIQWEAC